MAGVNLLADDAGEAKKPGRVNLLADENPQVGQGQTPPNPESGGFFSDFAEGYDGTFPFDPDKSINVKAGAIGTELLVKHLGGKQGRELVEFGQETKKLQKWKPLVWEAEDKLNAVHDKKSKEYQSAWENLQNTRKSMEDDLAGNFQPNEGEGVNLSQMVDAMKSNPGTFAGAITSALVADPALLLVPGGMLKAGNAAVKATQNASRAVQVAAKLAAQSAGSAAVGIPLGVGADIIMQLEQNPDKPIDFDRVKDTAVLSGVAAAALPLAGAALPLAVAGAKGIKTGINKGIVRPIANTAPVKKIGEILDARGVRKVEKLAQRIFNGEISDEGIPGISREAAVQRALVEANPSPAVQSKIDNLDNFMSEVALANRAQIDANPGVVQRAMDVVADGANKAADVWNDLTQPITTRLRNMGMVHIAKALNEHDMNVGTDIQRKQEIADKFSKAYDQLTDSQKLIAKININNGSFAGDIQNGFDDGFLRAFDDVRNMLDGEYEDMIDVGMKVGKTKDYFPREITDYEKYLNAQGVEGADINKDLAKAINAKLNLHAWSRLSPSDMTPEMIRRHLTEADIAKIINQRSQKLDPVSSVAASTNNLSSRSIETVTPELLPLYADPRAALHNHINRVTVKIHDRRFFGGKKINEDIEALGPPPDDESLMESYIRDYAARASQGKDIPQREMDKVVDILNARFIGAKRRAKPMINNTKNLLYAMTLGNPVAASTQLGDLGAAAYLNGVTKGINGVIGEAIEGTRFRMADFGLDAIPELESLGATRKILNWSLRKGGFHEMDKLGKETILNSTYKKLRDVGAKLRELQSPENAAENIFDPIIKQKIADEKAKVFKYYKERFGKRLGDDEVQNIIDGIQSGDPANPHARLAMYSDLTRVQPISMSEMPIAYLNNPNMRIFYMLKTFTLKQIDLMRNEVLDEIVTGAKAGNLRQVQGGAYNMAKIIGTIGAANMGVDYTKRWMRGKERDLPDVMVDTILRNYGLSSYTTSQILRGEYQAAVAKMLAPPFSAIENPVRAMFGVDTKGRWIDSIPVVGRTARFGKEVIDEHF